MITPIASLPRDQAHMAPVVELLPQGGDIALVAAYGDLKVARRQGFTRFVLMQHGAGQSYAGDLRTARHPSYPGGDRNDEVGLFVVPNEHSAERWRQAYPQASVAVVGCPRLDFIPHREPGPGPVVAVSFHWDGYNCPEMRSAFTHYRTAVVELSKTMHVIGHGHPKRKNDLPAFYRAHGIEYVPDFDDVCRRADVYVCDNSSTLFEFASTGRPVVVLNAPWYRMSVDHGLRFWDAMFVGEPMGTPSDLPMVVESALRDPLRNQTARETALDIVYAYRTGGAQRAADAIREWAAVPVAA